MKIVCSYLNLWSDSLMSYWQCWKSCLWQNIILHQAKYSRIQASKWYPTYQLSMSRYDKYTYSLITLIFSVRLHPRVVQGPRAARGRPPESGRGVQKEECRAQKWEVMYSRNVSAQKVKFNSIFMFPGRIAQTAYSRHGIRCCRKWKWTHRWSLKKEFHLIECFFEKSILDTIMNQKNIQICLSRFKVLYIYIVNWYLYILRIWILNQTYTNNVTK